MAMQPRSFFCFLSILLFFLAACSPICAQNQNPWYEDIFAYVSGQLYIVPDFAGAISPELAGKYGVSEAVVPYPGFRAGAGYEWKAWSFGLEFGYTYIKGDNPLVSDIAIVPLLLKAGYSFFPVKNYQFFSVTPTAAMGIVFADVNHYKDAIDALLDKSIHSQNSGFLAQLGARAGWNPVRQWGRAFEVFAALSIDCIMETGGVIPLPQIELGVLVRPFKFNASKVPIVHEEPQEIFEEEILEEEVEELIEEEPEPPEPVRYAWLALFPADRTSPEAEGRAVLDRVGAFMAGFIAGASTGKNDWEFVIVIKGYAAPFVSAEWQSRLSEGRAQYCASYLKERYGLSEETITVEWYGAEALPENIEENDHASRRSVEIIFEGRIGL